MSELNILINTIEAKLEALINKIDILEREKIELEKRLTLEIDEKKVINESLNQLKLNYDSLKYVNSLLGSEEHKRETKLKINSLIREIDHCISQLSK
ncbi:hypothetical protein EG240_01830 [Paenimyroides tangerinum]|uniref:Mis12-Mtw1 protein family n=1 Tax=Paenimyroides tangerinum TaxID=2488728 RepID=A0A3P3WCJ6_9FLAO|nr:hypothetical protein [Paenimyroides tangerinum]RRJ92780.1 hypothetical protein EG240_01830 [Paenimyroides tangerinum]